MPATATWCEDHGAATGSPAKGTVRDGFGADTNYPVNCNWKTADDTNTTAASAADIDRPDCSYEKFQYVKFAGTFTSIYDVKWTAHNDQNQIAGIIPGDLIKLMGTVSSTYTTPSRSVNAALTTNFTEQVWAHRGLPVLMTTTGPEVASPTAVLTAAGYTQYLISQIQVAAGAANSPSSNTHKVVIVWSET